MTTLLSKAKCKYIPLSPYKLRRIANLVRGKNALLSQSILSNMPHKSARILLKVLNSAIANINNSSVNLNNIFLETLLIDEGPRHKRQSPRARGRMDIIVKRTSHIFVELGEKNGTKS